MNRYYRVSSKTVCVKFKFSIVCVCVPPETLDVKKKRKDFEMGWDKR